MCPNSNDTIVSWALLSLKNCPIVIKLGNNIHRGAFYVLR